MKVGLIGYGYWGGGFVARNLARVAELAVVVDQNASVLSEATKLWAPWGAKVTSDPRHAFEECDAVWIATPATTHFDLAEQALLAGCHVLVEKPVVMDVAQAQALCAIASNEKLALAGGFTSLYTGVHLAARNYVRAASSGIRKVEVVRHTCRASKSDHSVLWGLGPHDVAAVLDLLGQPESVEWSGNEHRVNGVWRYPDDLVATFSFDWLSAEKDRWIEIDHCPIEKADRVEPLFAEAQAFVGLCLDHDDVRRHEHRQRVLQVTEVLSVVQVAVPEVGRA